MVNKLKSIEQVAVALPKNVFWVFNQMASLHLLIVLNEETKWTYSIVNQ